MIGQSDIMEYVILVMMTMFIIFFVIVLIFGFQIIGGSSEQFEEYESKSLFVMKSIITSQIFNNPQYQKGSVFDDSKLTVIECDDIEKLFGYDVWIEVRSVYEKPDCEKVEPQHLHDCLDLRDAITAVENEGCDTDVYPNCGVWEYCETEKRTRMVYRSIPVNIYKKINDTIGMGVLTVGIPVGGGE